MAKRLRLYRGAKRGESEAALERWCCRKATERGWRSRKMNGLGFRDWPDRLFIRPPKYFIGRHSASNSTCRPPLWVEFKKLGKAPTANQVLLHKFLRDCGESVHVVDTKEAFVALLDE